MRLLIVLSLLLTVLLYGCAAEGVPLPSLPGTTPATKPAPPELTMPSALPQPPEPSAEEAVRLAKEYLAARLQIGIDEISVIIVEKVDWPDTSLGLPEPDKVYAQVIVPGFRIALGAQGQEYRYHAGWMGGRMVVIPADTKPRLSPD